MCRIKKGKKITCQLRKHTKYLNIALNIFSRNILLNLPRLHKKQQLEIYFLATYNI